MDAARAEWLGKVRKQAQVYASAWALVGSRFDQGAELENANHQGEELMRLVDAGPASATADDRQDFEAWCVRKGFARALPQGGIDFYRYSGAGMWEAWQASRERLSNGS